MGSISLTHNVSKLRSAIQKKAKNLDKALAVEVAKEAYRTHADLTKETPVGYTGDTRRAWKTKRISNVWYRVENNEKVMFWLENGTKRRFPRRSKNLFIPKKHSAWKAGGYQKGMKHGRDFVFAKSAKGLKPLGLIPKQSNITAKRLRSALGKSGKI